ncbi:MAG TPA: hypothetical protein VHW94_05585, partial [Candidatus Dormibacteraeota bacterium]|nr:hypothetical protein [Candidatus Dormibacteraeota bacterium]
MSPPAAPPPKAGRSRSRLFVGIVSAVTLLVIAAIALGVILVGLNVVHRAMPKGGPVVASTDLTS